MKKTAKKKLSTLVLDPKRWVRGEGMSALLLDDGRMCCLGFECIRRGARKDQIRGIGLPCDVARLPGGKRAFAAKVKDYFGDSQCIDEAIAAINDDVMLAGGRSGDLARIRKLRPLFERLGVRLVLGREK